MEINKERRDAILRLRGEGKTYGQICKELNCTKGIVAFYCNPNRYAGIEKDKEKEKAKQEYEDLVCRLITECDNINQVCKSLGKRPTNNNYAFIKAIINKYNIDTSHFCVDFTKRRARKPYTKEEIFRENSNVQTSRLLPAILKYKLKEYRCECCGNSEWMGKTIPLQTHHINGDTTDNRIENLQLLCPNCHAQTDSYCGRNKKRWLPETHKVKKCPICGNPIYGKQNKFCSEACYNEWKKQKYAVSQLDITKEKLIDAFKNKKNFKQVGVIFSVSDNTIRKWCKKFGLPHKTKDMKIYLNANIA